MMPAGRSAADLVLVDAATQEHGVSLWRGALRRLRRNPSAILGALIVLALVVIAIIAPLLTPYEPASHEWAGEVTPSSVPGPSPEHRWGLDSFGSDMWTQMLFGARQSLVYGVVSTAIGLAAGTALGLIAGGFGSVGGRVGRWVDSFVMRLVDIMLAIPSLLLEIGRAHV